MRIDRHSLSGQLVVSISLVLSALWILGVALAIHIMRGEFDEVFDSALQETTERLAPLVVDDFFHRETRSGPYQIADQSGGNTDGYLTYQVRDPSGRVLVHSHNVNSVGYPAPLQPGFWSGDGKRIFTLATVSNSLFIQVADSLDHRREATLESALALSMPILLLLPLGMLATWGIVVRATRPIGALSDAISERDGANLDPIAIKGLPTEIATIPHSVNTLLDRLKLAFQAERDLAANAAHELRTPLAGALAQTELLADQLDRKTDKARAHRVLDVLRRLSLTLEKLLQLSRADAGIGVSETPVDLSALVDLIVREFRRANATTAVDIVWHGDVQPISRMIDPDAFAIAFKNLLENAMRYGRPDRPITVTLCAAGWISVRNHAAGALDPDINVYRQRFKRGSVTVPGSGLGLPIVDKLMKQMNGTMELRAVPTEDSQMVFECQLSFLPNNGP